MSRKGKASDVGLDTDTLKRLQLNLRTKLKQVDRTTNLDNLSQTELRVLLKRALPALQIAADSSDNSASDNVDNDVDNGGGRASSSSGSDSKLFEMTWSPDNINSKSVDSYKQMMADLAPDYFSFSGSSSSIRRAGRTGRAGRSGTKRPPRARSPSPPAAKRQKMMSLASRQASAMPVYLDDPTKPVERQDVPDSKINSGFRFNDFDVGELVESFYDGYWYQAYITDADKVSQLFTLHWPDDMTSSEVEPRFIRKIRD